MPAGEMVGAKAATSQTHTAEPVAAAATLQAVRLLRTQRVPAGIGVAVLFVAVFALILGNPFQTGGAQGVLDATDTPSARASGIASEPTANETPDAGAVRLPRRRTNRRDRFHRPAGRRTRTDHAARSDAHAATGRDARAARCDSGPTATPPPTPTPPQSTPPPTPTPTPTAAPDATADAHTRTDAHADASLPDRPEHGRPDGREGAQRMERRRLYRGFTAPTGPAKPIVTSQSQPRYVPPTGHSRGSNGLLMVWT